MSKFSDKKKIPYCSDNIYRFYRFCTNLQLKMSSYKKSNYFIFLNRTNLLPVQHHYYQYNELGMPWYTRAYWRPGVPAMRKISWKYPVFWNIFPLCAVKKKIFLDVSHFFNPFVNKCMNIFEIRKQFLAFTCLKTQFPNTVVLSMK